MKEDNTLISLLERGGVFYDIPGTTVKDVMNHFIGMIDLPTELNKDTLLQAVLEREQLMSTGIGHGLALPHPRNPLTSIPEHQSISIGFPKEAINWKSLDGKPVHTLILIVSASPKLHLHTLSRISFLCRQESFVELLQNRSSAEILKKAIQDAEAAWN
jgi:PTS system nitrogen regulatory IIA component